MWGNIFLRSSIKFHEELFGGLWQAPRLPRILLLESWSRWFNSWQWTNLGYTCDFSPESPFIFRLVFTYELSLIVDKSAGLCVRYDNCIIFHGCLLLVLDAALSIYSFLKFYCVFIFGWVGSLLLCMGFSLVATSTGYSLLRCAGFSLQWLLWLRNTGSGRRGALA